MNSLSERGPVEWGIPPSWDGRPIYLPPSPKPSAASATHDDIEALLNNIQ